jgi:hypothetical protein
MGFSYVSGMREFDSEIDINSDIDNCFILMNFFSHNGNALRDVLYISVLKQQNDILCVLKYG